MQSTSAKLAAEARQATKPAEHLVDLDSGQWSLWRCIGLRGAGFPANLLLKLSSSACSEAADECLDAEVESERTAQAALEYVRLQLDQSSLPRDRYILIEAIQQLKKRRCPEGLARRALSRYA